MVEDFPLIDPPAFDTGALQPVFEDCPRPTRKSKLPEVPPLRRSCPEKRRFVHLEKVAAAVKYLAPLPDAGEEIFGTLNGAFAGFDLVRPWSICSSRPRWHH